MEGVDLSGQRILVTGVSAGLGVETARALAAHGASVVGPARDLGKAAKATAHIPGLELVELDLASLASVRACADALNAAGKPFDRVIANAGVMATPKGTTADGFETQFGTNHLGHFVLVNRIAGLIKDGGRLVNLSSSGHRFSDVDLDDPNFEHTPYTEFGAYGRSKTANVLFAVEFDFRHKGRGVRAAAVHPGGIRTELSRHMPPAMLEQLRASITANRPEGEPEFRYKSVPQGAAASRGVGRPVGRPSRRPWATTIVRGLPRGRNRQRRRCALRRARLRPRRRPRQGPVGQERGDGRRDVLIGRRNPSPSHGSAMGPSLSLWERF